MAKTLMLALLVGAIVAAGCSNAGDEGEYKGETKKIPGMEGKTPPPAKKMAQPRLD